MAEEFLDGDSIGNIVLLILDHIQKIWVLYVMISLVFSFWIIAQVLIGHIQVCCFVFFDNMSWFLWNWQKLKTALSYSEGEFSIVRYIYINLTFKCFSNNSLISRYTNLNVKTNWKYLQFTYKLASRSNHFTKFSLISLFESQMSIKKYFRKNYMGKKKEEFH